MFSVVIPLYNKELSIRNTIQSVLDQTFPDFEVVVVNDGSTDNSAKILGLVSDKRIRIIHQHNQGVSAARNRGIEEARYEWIALLDGDDLWGINHLEEIVAMMRLFPGNKVFVTSFEYSDKRVAYKHPRNESIFKIENYFKEAGKEFLIWSSIVVFNKSCIRKVGGFNQDLKRGEDTDLWTRLAREYEIVKSKEVTAIYRVDAENRTSLSKDLESTHVFHYDFNRTSSHDEHIYYKNMILWRMYAYSRAMDINNFIKLKNRHPTITWLQYFMFLVRTSVHVFFRKIRAITQH